jgi:catechol 2,3-dioxygenase-like lactoylglutathione lyase family enzyme
VGVAVLELGGVCLELFAAEEPLAASIPGGSRNAPGFRHFCLQVPSVTEAYSRLTAAGVTFTVEPRAARVFPGARLLCFCQDPDGLLVELMEFGG